MNPKEPACFTMLGIVAWQQRNYHLAVSAFQKSVFGEAAKELYKFSPFKELKEKADKELSKLK